MWKFIKKITNEKIVIIVLICFIISQPFLDIYLFYTNPNLQIMGFSIPTLIRSLIIAYLLFATIKNFKWDTKHKCFIIYFAISIVFFLFHHLYTSGSLKMPEFSQYVFSYEFFYFIKMLFPFFMIYITYNSNITKQDFFKAITISGFIVALIIILTNTFKVSIGSYSLDSKIDIAWYEWTKETYVINDFSSFASKGWFYVANQISGLAVFLFLIIYAISLKEEKKFGYITSILLAIAMMMISTRVATYGWLLAVIATSFTYFLVAIINKKPILNKRIIFRTLVLLIILTPVFYFSPIQQRKYYDSIPQSVIDNKDNHEEKVKELDIDFIDIDEKSVYNACEYIEYTYPIYEIKDIFIHKWLPCKYNYKFWLNVFSKSQFKIYDTREMELEIANQLFKDNSNIKTLLLGVSASRFNSAELYIERDFYSQYYQIGIIGSIIIFIPYIYVFCLYLYRLIKNKQKYLTISNVSLLVAIFAILGVGFTGGHILNEIFITIYIGFTLGYLLKALND